MLNTVVSTLLYYIEIFTLYSALRLYIHNDAGFFSRDHDCQDGITLDPPSHRPELSREEADNLYEERSESWRLKTR